MKDVYFGGHGLNNKGNGKNMNKYTTLTLSECQELCQITDNCFYFNHVDSNCFLKYGMGKKCELGKKNETDMKARCSGIATKETAYFGHKYSKGITLYGRVIVDIFPNVQLIVNILIGQPGVIVMP